MRKLKIYLDTSVVNFIHAPDAPDYMKVTLEFFEKFRNEYEVFISDIVLIEIERTIDQVRRKELFSYLEKYNLTVYDELHEEIQELALKYVAEGVIPENKMDDALHIAFAVYYEFDILLSWNFKHIANIKKQMMINSINEREGYSKELRLTNPLEVIYEE